MPWQVLAAINEIETDYGRNLSVSSAGAVGWMQFLPSTWKTWGVDANGDGIADPYNPVDAIFTAARYLHAAGASKNLSQAIFAYNHAGWYVQSVLLRAKLIGGIPSQLIGALTGLVQGHFPVAAPAKYADDSVVSLAKHKVKGSNAAIAIGSDPNSKGTSIFAKKGSPVIAVNDGKIVKVGADRGAGPLHQAPGLDRQHLHLRPPRLGVEDLPGRQADQDHRQGHRPGAGGAEDQGADARRHRPACSRRPRRRPPAPRPPATAKTPKALRPASAGKQAAPTVKAPKVKTHDDHARRAELGLGRARRWSRSACSPTRLAPASYAAGGNLQLKNTSQQVSSFENYFSDALHLGKKQYTLKRLKAGSIVIAGTILGRIGGPSQGVSSHLYFTIQPAGKNAPEIDPKPILDGWKLLEATAVYRAADKDPFYGPGAKNPTVGQVLLMSKQQLTERVLLRPARADLQLRPA